MKELELKKVVAELLQSGKALPEIQKVLEKEYNHQIMFFDLRILASELENINWEQFDPVKEEKEEEKPLDGTGETTIEISNIQKPGFMFSGSVIFASGAKANWALNQMGQLTLDKEVGKATKEDLESFQMELQQNLQKQM